MVQWRHETQLRSHETSPGSGFVRDERSLPVLRGMACDRQQASGRPCHSLYRPNRFLPPPSTRLQPPLAAGVASSAGDTCSLTSTARGASEFVLAGAVADQRVSCGGATAHRPPALNLLRQPAPAARQPAAPTTTCAQRWTAVATLWHQPQLLWRPTRRSKPSFRTHFLAREATSLRTGSK